MKEYNFDENKNMGETVRIDDIKLRLNEMEEQGEGYDGEYDDFDDYDDDYDDYDGDDYDYDDRDDPFGTTAEVPSRDVRTAAKRNTSTPSTTSGSTRRSGKKTGRPPKKTVKWLYVLAAVVMVIFVFAAVFFVKNMGSTKNDNEQTAQADESFYGVVSSVSDNTFEIINTDTGKITFYTVGKDVVITKADGRKAAYTTINRGDIIKIGLSEETGDIVSIDYTNDVWEKKNVTDLEIDQDKMTISNGVTTYDYDKNTLFIYNGEFIKAEDLDKSDTVTLKGVDDKVWTVTVDKYHGYIKLENVDKIDNPVITIDGKEVEFEDNQAAVSAGAHSLGISGSNIEELTVDIHITAGEVYSVDLASVQEKTGVLTLNVNVDNCIIVVDGKQVSKDEPVVLSLGTYPISVSAEGYKTYNGTVVIDEPLVEVDIELEKIEVKTATITVDSTPSGATVYANGAVIGVTPFTTQINYGDYKITFKKDGYMDYNVDTSVNEDRKTISVLLTEE